MSERNTIFAMSSGRPPAAVGIVRISGPRAHEAGRALAGSLPEARCAALRELRDPRTGERLDQALLLRFDRPASATGDDVVELHCHGGRAVVDAVLCALAHVAGLREALPGEFTRRSFENGRIDLTEAEGLADLIEAETQSQRRAAQVVAGGGLRQQIQHWQERLLVLSAAAEQAIDYVGEEENGEDFSALLYGCSNLAEELGSWLSRPRMEPLKQGIRIVIAGPPNAGKSSLLNAIAGYERAIVSDVPGTTRDHLEVTLSLAGAPVVLTDTAGIRATSDEIEGAGVERAKRLTQDADVLLWLGPLHTAPQHPRLFLVHPKSDLGGDIAPGALAVSARTAEGIQVLLKHVSNAARTLLPPEDAIALNRRQAAELEVAAEAIGRASYAKETVLVAEDLRQARAAFDRLTGRAGVEDVLDALFSRFCLGK